MDEDWLISSMHKNPQLYEALRHLYNEKMKYSQQRRSYSGFKIIPMYTDKVQDLPDVNKSS